MWSLRTPWESLWVASSIDTWLFFFRCIASLQLFHFFSFFPIYSIFYFLQFTLWKLVASHLAFRGFFLWGVVIGVYILIFTCKGNRNYNSYRYISVEKFREIQKDILLIYFSKINLVTYYYLVSLQIVVLVCLYLT